MVGSLAWPPGRAEGVFQAQPPGGCLDPARLAQGRAVAGAAAQAEVLGVQRGIDVVDPVRRPGHRPGVQPRHQRRFGPGPQAGPRPGLGLRHQAGAGRIAFDVPQDGPEVLVLLNREGLEAALPELRYKRRFSRYWGRRNSGYLENTE